MSKRILIFGYLCAIHISSNALCYFGLGHQTIIGQSSDAHNHFNKFIQCLAMFAWLIILE